MDTSLLAVCVGLCSAITLALANAFVKASGDVLMSRAALSTSAALIVLPLAFFVPLPNLQTWGILALSVPAHALYQFALIKAMTRGDLSLVFPLMRGSAPLITAVAAFFLLQETLSFAAVTGLVIASLATIVFALPDRQAPGAGRLKAATLFWALMTGAGVALYNIVDAFGVRAAPTVITFITWLFLLDWVCINVAALWSRRGNYLGQMRLRWRYGAAAGALSVLSFGLVLWGFRIAPVAYVSALRETSVVFAAILGVGVLKEGFGFKRVFAAIALAFGLILMQTG